MGRHQIPAPDPVRQLLIGEVQSPQFREMVDTHSPLLMRLIRASIAFHDMEHKAVAEATGYKARHIRRFLNGELAKTDEEAAKKLAEMRKYQSQATVRSYQKMKADAEAGDPDAIKRYETTLAKRREEYHRKKGA